MNQESPPAEGSIGPCLDRYLALGVPKESLGDGERSLLFQPEPQRQDLGLVPQPPVGPWHDKHQLIRGEVIAIGRAFRVVAPMAGV